MRYYQNDSGFPDFSVRDQEVGGSNPLAPTTSFNYFGQLGRRRGLSFSGEDWPT